MNKTRWKYSKIRSVSFSFEKTRDYFVNIIFGSMFFSSFFNFFFWSCSFMSCTKLIHRYSPVLNVWYIAYLSVSFIEREVNL